MYDFPLQVARGQWLSHEPLQCFQFFIDERIELRWKRRTERVGSYEICDFLAQDEIEDFADEFLAAWLSQHGYERALGHFFLLFLSRNCILGYLADVVKRAALLTMHNGKIFTFDIFIFVEMKYNRYMLNSIKKYLVVFFVLTLALGIFIFAENKQTVFTGGISGERLEVDFLDVGQGDGIYIRTPDDVDVLIDGGPDKNVLTELSKVMPFWDREIDVMILTHPHSDHVTGLVEVLRRYKVKQIYYTGVLHTASDYLAWLKEIKDQKIPLYIIDGYKEVALGEKAKMEFLFSGESLVNKKVENLNNTSIVTRLLYGETKFLFTGDLESEMDPQILDSGHDLSSDVLKVAHHGSKTASSEEFLQTVNSKIAIIQSGLDNDFGHPHLITLERLKRRGIEILRNDELGTIRVYSDRNNISY